MNFDMELAEMYAKNVFNMVVVLESFCRVNSEVWEIENISALVTHINREADLLYAMFIDYRNS